MGRYSDIRRAKELLEAQTKLRAWEDKTLKEKRAIYKAQRGSSVRVNVKRTEGYVESFQLEGRIFLPAKVLSDSQTGTNTALANKVREAVQTDNRVHAPGFALPVGGVLLDGFTGYRPARFALVERGREVSDNNSRITDLEYKRYDNKCISAPFGSKTSGDESYADAKNSISKIAAIKTFLETEGNRVSFTPEVI